MMKKLLFVFVSATFVSACTSISVATPPTTPTRSSSIVTSVPAATASSPTATALPTAAVEDVLAQQISADLSANPRPACQAGTIPGKEWGVYRDNLAASLRKLFADSRAQSLSLQSLADTFKKGSGLSLDAYESNSDAALVSILNSNCDARIGGGASPESPRDTVYVLNRHDGLWQIAQVANVVEAGWAQDHWVALVTKTKWGNQQDFEVWHVRATAGEWKNESMLRFSQLYGDPPPRLSDDGNTVTLYSMPAACGLPKNLSAPYPRIESDYQWQNGQYKCIASRVIPTPTPTRQP